MKLSFIRYKIKEKERFIIQVHVPESVVKPVILKYKNTRLFYEAGWVYQWCDIQKKLLRCM